MANAESMLEKENDEKSVCDKNRRRVTLAEVSQHCSREDAWTIIGEDVVDISKFMRSEFHPGGEVIWTHAGKDATDVFEAYHPQYVYKRKLVKYRVGVVADPPKVDPMIQEFREMTAAMKKSGLYDNSRPWYWLNKAVYPGLMLALAIAVFRLQVQSVWVNVLAGVLVGLAMHQWAFIGHDGCHASCSLDNAPDFLFSIVFGSLGFGVSSIWWKYTHNQHHVVTNEYDRDPDITHLPFYAVHKYMFLSESKGKPMGDWERRLCRCLVQIQWLTFFPVMLIFARASLLVNMLLMLFVTHKVPTMPWQHVHYPRKWLWADRIAVLSHYVWVWALFVHLPPVGFRFASFAACWVMVSFLHVQLVLSHWERPSKHSSEEDDNWFVKQVVTGLNIEPYVWNEWFLGGLHFQIEHHIFPRMPRYHLRRCRDEYVKPFCRKWGVPYHSEPFWASVLAMWRSLLDVSTYAMKPMVQ